MAAGISGIIFPVDYVEGGGGGWPLPFWSPAWRGVPGGGGGGVLLLGWGLGGMLISPRFLAMVTLVTLGCLNSDLEFMRGCCDVFIGTPSVSCLDSGSLWVVASSMEYMDSLLSLLWKIEECFHKALLWSLGQELPCMV